MDVRVRGPLVAIVVIVCVSFGGVRGASANSYPEPSASLDRNTYRSGETATVTGEDWHELRDPPVACTQDMSPDIIPYEQVRFAIAGPVRGTIRSISTAVDKGDVPLVHRLPPVGADDDSKIRFSFDVPELDPGRYALIWDGEFGHVFIHDLEIRFRSGQGRAVPR